MAGFYTERKYSTLKLVNRFFCHLTAVHVQKINGREAHIGLDMLNLTPRRARLRLLSCGGACEGQLGDIGYDQVEMVGEWTGIQKIVLPH